MTVFAKGLVGGWTDGKGCRLRGWFRVATVVHVGVRAGLGGGGWVGGERVLGVRRRHYEFLQAKTCVHFLRLQV